MSWFPPAQDASKRETIFGLRLHRDKGRIFITAIRLAKLPAIFRSIPGIWLDASGTEDFYRRLVGYDVNLTVERLTAKPVNYSLTQVVDRSFATSHFVPWNPDGPIDAGDQSKRKKRSDSHEDRLLRFVLFLSWLYRGKGKKHDGLVVVAKKLRTAIERKLPPNVAVLNYGKLRGIDAYRSVPFLVVCGRDMLHMSDLELLTEALHWDNPVVTSLQYVTSWPRSACRVLLADGTSIETTGEAHPDPYVAQLQKQISDAEVEQAIGRARLVLRSPEDPCDVYLLSPIGTSTPAHQIINWCDADRDLSEISIAAGVVFKNPDTLWQAFPSAVPSARRAREEAAAYAWWRATAGHAFGALTYYRRSVHTPLPKFRLGCFRFRCAPGERLKNRQDVLIDVARYEDPAAAIAGVLNVPTDQVEWLGWQAATLIEASPSRRLAGIVVDEPGRAIASRPACAIERRGVEGADWQRAEPPTAGIQDGVQSLADKVEDLSTQRVPELNQKLAEARRPTIPNSNTAA